MTSLAHRDVLEALAADEQMPAALRDAARWALAALRCAGGIAVAWGGDENADVRVSVFEDAACAPAPVGPCRVALALGLDELCRTLGVPLDGPVAGY